MPNLEIPDSSRFLKVAELAELLKVKPRTIYEMVAQHRIPYRKPPGTNILRFDLDEIWHGLAVKIANDFSLSCCYHALVLAWWLQPQENRCQFTNEVRKARTGITTSGCVAC